MKRNFQLRLQNRKHKDIPHGKRDTISNVAYDRNRKILILWCKQHSPWAKVRCLLLRSRDEVFDEERCTFAESLVQALYQLAQKHALIFEEQRRKKKLISDSISYPSMKTDSERIFKDSTCCCHPTRMHREKWYFRISLRPNISKQDLIPMYCPKDTETPSSHVFVIRESIYIQNGRKQTSKEIRRTTLRQMNERSKMQRRNATSANVNNHHHTWARFVYPYSRMWWKRRCLAKRSWTRILLRYCPPTIYPFKKHSKAWRETQKRERKNKQQNLFLFTMSTNATDSQSYVRTEKHSQTWWHCNHSTPRIRKIRNKRFSQVKCSKDVCCKRHFYAWGKTSKARTSKAKNERKERCGRKNTLREGTNPKEKKMMRVNNFNQLNLKRTKNEILTWKMWISKKQ